MARRRNSIAHRFARMRGLPPDEKALMQRIANLIDAALNNRQSSNPFEGSKSTGSRQIYPPTGILVKEGIKSVKLIWDATDSNELLRYEIKFDNLTTGERTIKSSFTNTIDFKAAAGSYIARITSVGRDGSTSPVKQVQFSVDEDVMQIEGDKNGPLEVGTLVQDNILLLQGYSVYVWGSCVLDKYIAATSNQSITLRLWRAEGADQTFGGSGTELLETIVLYPATEAFSNLDATARAGLITRPSGVRLGSFDTTQSVMFSPQAVAVADDRKVFTYFLEEIGRPVEDDQVCLSMVMWAGADGSGDSVPGDPFTIPPDYVFPNLNCLHTQKVGLQTINDQANIAWDTRSMWGSVDKEHQLIGNQWTICMWFRPDDLNVSRLSGDPAANTPDNINGGTMILVSRGAMIAENSTEDYFWNHLQIDIAGDIDASPDQHVLTVRLGDRENGPGGETRNQIVSYKANVQVSGDNDTSSGLFTWGDASNQSGLVNDAWYFIAVCFSGGDFVGGVPKLRCYMNSVTAPENTTRSTAGVTPFMAQLVPSGNDGSLQKIEQDDLQTMSWNIGQLAVPSYAGGNVFEGVYHGDLRYANCNNFQIHQMGVWNVCLDAVNSGQGASIGAIKTLFNEGHGTEIDWRINQITELDGIVDLSSSYFQAENLVHLIQYGAVEQPMSTGYPGRDTGNPLFGGDLNLTGTSVRYEDDPDQGWLPGNASPNDLGFTNTNAHYTDNTTIADILSPEGTNGTTQFDQAYPGQNLTGGSG